MSQQPTDDQRERRTDVQLRDATDEKKLSAADEKRIAELKAHFGWDKPVRAGELSRAHREPEVSRLRARIGLGPAPRNARERIFGRRSS